MLFFVFHHQLLPTLPLVTKRLAAFCLLLLSLASITQIASADIFEWEWINPADHSQGKQQSTTLVPDGAGLVPEPGLYTSYANLTQAYLSGANLMDAKFGSAKLTNADLSGANLTDVFFYDATLINADFTNAEVRGASFEYTTDFGFTAAQLYSTASYQAGNLTGIIFYDNDLAGWNFSGQNLTDTNFSFAMLINADFTNAEISGASFAYTTLSGFTSEQFYSTTSYQSGDLVGVSLEGNNLTGWNFIG